MVLVGALAGIAGAVAVLGAVGIIRINEWKEVPEWMQGVSSVVATAVSILAVWLVARTLKETQHALAVTQRMADDQAKIGDAQTRAWVYVDRWEFLKHKSGLRLYVYFKNYGNTPARNLEIEAYYQNTILILERDDVYRPKHDPDILIANARVAALPSGKEYRFYTTSLPINEDRDSFSTLSLRFSYKTINSEELYSEAYGVNIKGMGGKSPIGREISDAEAEIL